MHVLFASEKLKLRNSCFSGNVEKNLHLVWFWTRKGFEIFQTLTTKGKGMVMGSPAPRHAQRDLRQSRASPGSAMLLEVIGKFPEGLGTSTLFQPFWSILKSAEEQQAMEIWSTRKNDDGVVIKLLSYWMKVWLSVIWVQYFATVLKT